MRPTAGISSAGAVLTGSVTVTGCADNLTNSKYAILHDAIYSYYRLGMDNMYENETEARTAVLNTLIF